MSVDLSKVIPRVHRRFRSAVAAAGTDVMSAELVAQGIETWPADVSFAEWFALIEAKQRLHRRVQEAERAVAQARRESIELLVKKLADVSHERHLYRLENGFMKRERERLQARIRDLEGPPPS